MEENSSSLKAAIQLQLAEITQYDAKIQPHGVPSATPQAEVEERIKREHKTNMNDIVNRHRIIIPGNLAPTVQKDKVREKSDDTPNDGKGASNLFQAWAADLERWRALINDDPRESQYDFSALRVIKQPKRPGNFGVNAGDRQVKFEEEVHIKSEPVQHFFNGDDAATSGFTGTKKRKAIADSDGRPMQCRKQKQKQEEQEDTVQCNACTTDTPTKSIIQTACNCQYCSKCFKKLFETNLNSRELTKCCGKLVDVDIYAKFLPLRITKAHRDLKVELETNGPKLYCADPRCAKFIRPDKIKADGHGVCATCKKKTHVDCGRLLRQHDNKKSKNAAGAGAGTVSVAACPMGSEDDVLSGLVGKAGYKRCPHCLNVVEKTMGYNVIL